MSTALQVAGGLGIYRLKCTNFRKILKPSAKTLLLTGDCLTVGQSYETVTKEFMSYLQANWKQVIYIPGRSELRAPGAAVSLYSHLYPNVKFAYRTHYPLGSIYTVIGATYLTTGDSIWASTEAQWVCETLGSEVRPVVLASYCPLPKDTHTDNIAALVHGTGKNQFCPTKPIVNVYSDYNGELRSDYNPEYVLELQPPAAETAVMCAWLAARD